MPTHETTYPHTQRCKDARALPPQPRQQVVGAFPLSQEQSSSLRGQGGIAGHADGSRSKGSLRALNAWWWFCALSCLLWGCPQRTNVQGLVPPPEPRGPMATPPVPAKPPPRRRLRRSTHTYGSAPAYASYLKAQMLARKKQHKEAIRHYKFALVHMFEDPFLYFRIAEQYQHLKSWTRTIFWAKKALEQRKKYAPALQLLGEVYWRTKRRKLAIHAYKSAIKANPRFLKAYLALDRALAASYASFRTRRAWLRQLVKVLPQRYEGFERLAHLYRRYANTEKALYHYRQTLDRYPAHVYAMYYMGQLYAQQQRWDKAIRSYQVLLDYQGEAWEVRAELGAFFLSRAKPHDKALAQYQFRYIMREAEKLSRDKRALLIGKYLESRYHFKAALRWLRAANAIKADVPAVLYHLGFVSFRLGQRATAIQYLLEIKEGRTKLDAQALLLDIWMIGGDQVKTKAALARFRQTYDNPSAWIRLSQVFCERASPSGLQEELRQVRIALKRWPKQDELHFHHGYVLFKLKRYNDSQAILSKLLARNRQNAGVLNFLGYLYAERGVELKKAESLVLRALRIKPGNAYFLDSLGWIYYRQGRLKQAHRVLSAALQRLPREAMILAHLGMLYYRRGQWKRALRFFLRAQRLQPGPQLKQRIDARVQQLQRRLSRS